MVAPGSDSELEPFTIPLILEVVVWPVIEWKANTRNNKVTIFFMFFDFG